MSESTSCMHQKVSKVIVSVLVTMFQSAILNFGFTTSGHEFFQTHGSIKKLFDKAKNGDVLAQQDLGLAYYEGGDFLPKDIDKAIY